MTTSNGNNPLIISPDMKKMQLQINSLLLRLDRLQMARELGQTHQGKRDVWDVFGWPEDKDLTPEYYWQLYDRNPIAGAIIDTYPDDTWKENFILIDGDSRSDNPEKQTDFIKSWLDLTQRLQIWRHFIEVDKLARIGRFAILYIGTEGDIKSPVESVQDIKYLSVYGEPQDTGGVKINDGDLEKERASERYALPNMYTIGTDRVHYSHIIHVAEERLQNDVYGRPALKRVVNSLIDKDKITGGGAEAFWLNIRRGLAVIAEDGFPTDEEGQLAFAAEVDDYVHNLSRVMRLAAAKVQELGVDVASDPDKYNDVILQDISAATGIPKRKLIGSEEGQLAGSQDERAWINNVNARRQNYAEIVIARPFIDWLVKYNILPAPANGYTIEWPDLFEVDDKTRADIRKINAEAQAIEWDSSNTPPVTRLKEMYGEERLNELMQDAEDSFDFLPASQTNFEPGVAQ